MNHLYAKLRMLLALICCTLFMVHCSAAHAVSEGYTVYHGDRESKQIAITIDDCYDRECVMAAIELCEKYDIHITFFPVGNALKFADGPMWQRALDAGCEIGNHSWGHKDLTTLSARLVRFQMLRTQQKVDEMLGYHYPMQVMRPPYGNINKAAADAIESVGYLHIVQWDVSQTDAKKAIKDVENGSILLYHARKKDIRCLDSIIPQLIEQGYECVTVSELLGLEAVSCSDDIYYYESKDAKRE